MTQRDTGRARATIMDVARAAAVSRQTVSNVVNKPERVAPLTLERVHREIVRLGFKPNLAARALRLERANALGIELNSMGAGKMGSILDAFLVELTVASRQHNYHLVPFAAADHDAPVPSYQDLLASQLVDAFILTDTRHDDPRPAWLLERDVPFVAFGRVWDDPTLHAWVDVDGAAGVEAGVEHVLAQGYERVGFLGWPAGSPVGDDRRSGWARATRAIGIHEPSWQAESEDHLMQAAEATCPLIDTLGPGGAIVCASDTLAMGVWTAVRDRGLTPGVDFGIVGFDDTDLARSFGLTSLRQPLHEVAARTLDLLEAMRRNEPAPSEGTLFRPTITPRGSTDPARSTPSTARAGKKRNSPAPKSGGKR